MWCPVPLLEVTGSVCVWEEIGPSQNTHPGYCVCHLVSTKSLSHPGATWELFLVVEMVKVAGSFYAVSPWVIRMLCYQPSPAQVLDGSQNSHPDRDSLQVSTVLCREPVGSLFGPAECFPTGPIESAGTPWGRDFCPAVYRMFLIKTMHVYVYKRATSTS